jgi:hypothetical protein
MSRRRRRSGAITGLPTVAHSEAPPELWAKVAERKGFEPLEAFRLQRFSRPPPETTRPPLRRFIVRRPPNQPCCFGSSLRCGRFPPHCCGRRSPAPCAARCRATHARSPSGEDAVIAAITRSFSCVRGADASARRSLSKCLYARKKSAERSVCLFGAGSPESPCR